MLFPSRLCTHVTSEEFPSPTLVPGRSCRGQTFSEDTPPFWAKEQDDEQFVFFPQLLSVTDSVLLRSRTGKDHIVGWENCVLTTFIPGPTTVLFLREEIPQLVSVVVVVVVGGEWNFAECTLPAAPGLLR